MNQRTVISASGLEFLCLEELGGVVEGGMRFAPWHGSLLSFPETAKIYNAIAYAMFEHETIMNVHMTLNWTKLGITDPNHAIAALSEFNSQLAKWLRVGIPTLDHLRIGRRYGRNAKHVYVYVHENGPVEGFHTHQLCFVHPTVRREFKAWAEKCLSRFGSTNSLADGTLNIKLSCLRQEHEKVERCWSMFRYISKQLNQNIEINDKNGKWYDARSVFKAWPIYKLKPLPVKHAVFASRNIDYAAQKREGFRSRLQIGDFADMFDGRELQEGREHREMKAREANVAQMLGTIQF